MRSAVTARPESGSCSCRFTPWISTGAPLIRSSLSATSIERNPVCSAGDLDDVAVGIAQGHDQAVSGTGPRGTTAGPRAPRAGARTTPGSMNIPPMSWAASLEWSHTAGSSRCTARRFPNGRDGVPRVVTATSTLQPRSRRAGPSTRTTTSRVPVPSRKPGCAVTSARWLVRRRGERDAALDAAVPPLVLVLEPGVGAPAGDHQRDRAPAAGAHQPGQVELARQPAVGAGADEAPVDPHHEHRLRRSDAQHHPSVAPLGRHRDPAAVHADGVVRRDRGRFGVEGHDDVRVVGFDPPAARPRALRRPGAGHRDPLDAAACRGAVARPTWASVSSPGDRSSSKSHSPSRLRHHGESAGSWVAAVVVSGHGTVGVRMASRPRPPRPGSATRRSSNSPAVAMCAVAQDVAALRSTSSARSAWTSMFVSELIASSRVPSVPMTNVPRLLKIGPGRLTP